MENVLNQKLYNRLLRVFGRVEVSNRGEKMTWKRSLHPIYRTYQVKIQAPGEYYHVCCPFCGDTRFRLNINHMWDQQIAGKSLKYLVVCQNEHCEQDDSLNFRKTLEDMLKMGV